MARPQGVAILTESAARQDVGTRLPTGRSQMTRWQSGIDPASLARGVRIYCTLSGKAIRSPQSASLIEARQSRCKRRQENSRERQHRPCGDD